MKRTTIFVLVSAMLALTACETTAGLGRDLQKAGSSISGAAERNK